ncbi:MAG: phenylacetate--CoA ligase family protein [archaeon]
MFRKALFILGHKIQYPKFYSLYKQTIKKQWRPYEEQKKLQGKKLQKIIRFAYENVPYYHTLFKERNISPDDVQKIKDLENLPILSKEKIRANWEDLKPVNLSSMEYIKRTTGGTTGTPLEYRLSKRDRFLGVALIYRGLGYGGYDLGDKMLFLGGSSIGVDSTSFFKKKIDEVIRNIRKLSSFDMEEKEMKEYTKILNSKKPKFIRGYSSAIHFYAKWLQKNEIRTHSPDAIFTTSENLHPKMRGLISDTFDCEVFDHYGLNDGGVSAFECPKHNGLHIDTERSVMEVVDEENCQLETGKGRILATSLNNFAMPFIRYETGDRAHIVKDKCECGRDSKLLKEILGRTVDIFTTPEGKSVHGWFFLYIMWEYCEGVQRYQVVQNEIDHILIKLVINEDFDEGQLDKIREIMNEKSESWNLEFRFVDEIEPTESGKHKFIISEVE